MTDRHRPALRCVRQLAALLACVLLAGCLYQGEAVSVDERELATERDAQYVRVPVVRQEGEKDCGAAALAAILRYWGEAIDQGQIRRATGIAEDRAISAQALQRYLSERGYENFLFTGTLGDLQNELANRRPVLVGMLKPYAGKQWFAHYEVVIGISPEHVYTMNPASGLERYPRQGFTREWRGAKQLTLVIAPSPSAKQSAALGD